MAVKRKKSRKRTSYKSKNPGTHAPGVYHISNKKRGKRRSTRRRRNPDTGLSSSRMTVSNIAQAGAGAVLGAVAYETTNSLLQTEGNGKYLVGLGLAVAGWWGLDKFMPKMAVPFASGVIAILALDYLRDSGVLSGLLGQAYYSTPMSYGNTGMGLVAQPGMDGLGLVAQGNTQLMPAAAYAGISGYQNLEN